MTQSPRYILATSDEAQNQAKAPPTLEFRQSALNSSKASKQQSKLENHSRDDSRDHSRAQELRDHYEPIIREALQARIAEALFRLSLLAGNVAGRSFESSGRSVERQDPVDTFGNARGDVALAKLKARADKAHSIRSLTEILKAIEDEIAAVTVPRRVGWADRGTVQGRMMIAKEAITHGHARAAASYDVTTRTITRYVAEYKRMNRAA
jgi:hypothetical protein